MIGVASEFGDELAKWHVASRTPHQINQPLIARKIVETVEIDEEIVNMSVDRNVLELIEAVLC